MSDLDVTQRLENVSGDELVGINKVDMRDFVTTMLAQGVARGEMILGIQHQRGALDEGDQELQNKVVGLSERVLDYYDRGSSNQGFFNSTEQAFLERFGAADFQVVEGLAARMVVGIMTAEGHPLMDLSVQSGEDKVHRNQRLANVVRQRVDKILGTTYRELGQGRRLPIHNYQQINEFNKVVIDSVGDLEGILKERKETHGNVRELIKKARQRFEDNRAQRNMGVRVDLKGEKTKLPEDIGKLFDPRSAFDTDFALIDQVTNRLGFSW